MKMILLTEAQADQIKGNYGNFSSLEPIKVVEGYALPLLILDDMEFISVREYILTLPIQEVTLIIPDKIKFEIK